MAKALWYPVMIRFINAAWHFLILSRYQLTASFRIDYVRTGRRPCNFFANFLLKSICVQKLFLLFAGTHFGEHNLHTVTFTHVTYTARWVWANVHCHITSTTITTWNGFITPEFSTTVNPFPQPWQLIWCYYSFIIFSRILYKLVSAYSLLVWLLSFYMIFLR